MPVAHTPEQEAANLAEIVASRTAPGMTGFRDRGLALQRAKTYAEHNITRHMVTPDGMGGTVTADPIDEDRQCTCGDCSSHRKANRKTGVAAPGKNLEL